MASPSKKQQLAGGLISGSIIAVAFNPWDRALYLSMLHNRPFLTAANFQHPYQGFLQVLFHRTFSSGIYFPLFDIFKPTTDRITDRLLDSKSSSALHGRDFSHAMMLLTLPTFRHHLVLSRWKLCWCRQWHHA